MSMSPESQTIIEHLKLHGPTGYDALWALVPTDTRDGFTKRLANLRVCGWIEREEIGCRMRVYRLAGDARRRTARQVRTERSQLPRGRPPGPSAPPAKAENIVPPRRINVMAGTLGPDPDPVYRPGAMQFMAIQSRGLRC